MERGKADIGYSSGPAGHTAAIYAARADLKRESSLGVIMGGMR